MNILAFNASPRKKWNTATMLAHVLDGARSKGAECEMIHLYDLAYKGCISCFECKKIGGKSYGRCAVKDELAPVLERAARADALVFGSPVYFGTESGEARSFLERLLFPFVTYTPGYQAIAPKKMPTALIYTMNVKEEALGQLGYNTFMNRMQGTMARVFGSCEVLTATDTCQFKDYGKYLTTAWDAAAKAKRREEVFPQDCAKAYALGERLAAPQAGEPIRGAM
ncbi:flavodoxin family protein [Fundidesulfovibrio terrae]|uniref:flavodoxin family protein n=1 Tax=Fundidesulfovibrio terrae TaxID=2922866 RepID=UPI001FAED9B1|nr:flavodoxin family protein [Fundidesulfovibrio terrae]